MLKQIVKTLSKIGKIEKYLILLIARAPIETLLLLTQTGFLYGAFYSIRVRNQSLLIVSCLVFGIISCILYLYNGIVWSNFGSEYVRICGKLRLLLMNKLLRMSFQQLEANTQGDLLTRLNQDVKSTGNFFGEMNHLPHLFMAICKITTASLLLICLNFRMLAIVLLSVIPHVLLQYFFISKKMTQYQTEAHKKVGECTDVMISILSTRDLTVLYDADEMLMNTFSRISRELYREKMKMVLITAINDILIPFFGLSGYLAIIFTGADLILSSKMEFEALVAVFQIRGGVLVGGLSLIQCILNLRISMAGMIRTNEMIS